LIPHIILLKVLMSKALILSLLMLSIAFSLEVAINSNDYRCMVVYSTSEEDHLKLNIKFRKLAVENNGYYEILLTNTETEATDRYTIEEGNFRKELQLTESTHVSIQMWSIKCASKSWGRAAEDIRCKSTWTTTLQPLTPVASTNNISRCPKIC
jgi:hypothetical protein